MWAIKLRRGWSWLQDWTLLGVRSRETLELTLSYFKEEMQGNPGGRANRDFRDVGICGGWAVGFFIQQRITGYHWAPGRAQALGTRSPLSWANNKDGNK